VRAGTLHPITEFRHDGGVGQVIPGEARDRKLCKAVHKGPEQEFGPALRNGRVGLVPVGAMGDPGQHRMAFLARGAQRGMGYMIFMASRGAASHFNQATAFTQAMYSRMGIGAT
jgi:hypothetical protein